jgi:hypothetical protein
MAPATKAFGAELRALQLLTVLLAWLIPLSRKAVGASPVVLRKIRLKCVKDWKLRATARKSGKFAGLKIGW